VNGNPDHAPGPLLVIGAHAFDAEVMGGGLAATWSRLGAFAILLHVSLGEAGHAQKAVDEYAAQKRAEALRAAAALGAQVRFLDRPDTQLERVEGIDTEIARVVREVRPATVVTHWRGSWHPDHVATHYATLRGLLLAGLPGPALDQSPATSHAPHTPREILYGENWEDGEGFRPQMYMDITDGFEAWQAALEEYEIGRVSNPGFPYRDYYTSLARMRGCLCGVRYAETFLPAPTEVRTGLAIPSPDRGPRP
jgi:LmbE family N-acetylglucosaminyl deacetylase